MSGADFSLTTFSPSGKLVQIEYALAAVNTGKTSLGIKGQWTPELSEGGLLTVSAC
jgi:20S proteasome alpha/beta subunit